MSIQEIYNPNFVVRVTDTLAAKCVNGETLTRTELCHELDLTSPLPAEPKEPRAKKDKGEEETPAWKTYLAAKAHNLTVEAVVGGLISLGVITGFEARKGPGGGIGKLGEKRSAAPKDPNKKPTRNVEFPDGFLDSLTATVDSLCKGTEAGTVKVGPKGSEVVLNTVGCAVPRRDIAKAMGMPGSDTDALISIALSNGHLSGFISKRGVGGGIVRLASGEVPAEPQLADETDDASFNVELQAQAETELAAAAEFAAADALFESELDTQAAEPEASPEVEAEAAPKTKGKGGKGKSGKKTTKA